MNISTYIPDTLLAEVDAFASKHSLSRSAIIREGLELYLTRHRPDGWPDIIRTWQGQGQIEFEPMPKAILPISDPFTAVVRSL